MPLFLGEYQHTLDAKGRVILPSKFRTRLAEGCVLTRGQETCLAVYTRDAFQARAERLTRAKLSNQRARNIARQFFAGAHEEEPDKQGRVVVPEPLRRYAGLDKDVVVIGAGNWLEIWDTATWENHQRSTEPDYRDLDIEDEDFDF
ncbi:MAG TPA: division/cell wall cluster transcriptional repressor MraZ [Actinomycetota bacterium]